MAQRLLNTLSQATQGLDRHGVPHWEGMSLGGAGLEGSLRRQWYDTDQQFCHVTKIIRKLW